MKILCCTSPYFCSFGANPFCSKALYWLKSVSHSSNFFISLWSNPGLSSITEIEKLESFSDSLWKVMVMLFGEFLLAILYRFSIIVTNEDIWGNGHVLGKPTILALGHLFEISVSRLP